MQVSVRQMRQKSQPSAAAICHSASPGEERCFQSHRGGERVQKETQESCSHLGADELVVARAGGNCCCWKAPKLRPPGEKQTARKQGAVQGPGWFLVPSSPS